MQLSDRQLHFSRSLFPFRCLEKHHLFHVTQCSDVTYHHIAHAPQITVWSRFPATGCSTCRWSVITERRGLSFSERKKNIRVMPNSLGPHLCPYCLSSCLPVQLLPALFPVVSPWRSQNTAHQVLQPCRSLRFQGGLQSLGIVCALLSFSGFCLLVV